MSTKSVSAGRAAPGRRQDTGSSPTTADLVVLGLLCERPMHGYDLVREYDRQEVRDWAALSRPHVYYSLQKLARRGLIALVPDDGAGRDRMTYAIQPRGRTVLADALAEAAWATSRPPAPFTTWLGLSIHSRPEDVRRVCAIRRGFLAAEISRETATLDAIRADRGDRALVAEAMVSLCIRQFEVELNWLNEFIERLPQP